MKRLTQQATIQLPAVRVAFEWFLRIVALSCMVYGLIYWVRMLGIFPGTNWRFDLMPLHWQVVTVCLAVLYPLAATGLWMTASWGPVIWTVCALTELVMHAGFPQLFGGRDLLLAGHAAVAVAYIGFRILLRMERKRREAQS